MVSGGQREQYAAADVAIRRDQPEQAARLLGASVGVRGPPDRSYPDVARIEQEVRRRLGEAKFAEAALEGTQASWYEERVVVMLVW